jgi:hypothetical protein
MNIFLISRTRFRRLHLNNFQNEKQFGIYKLHNYIGPILFYLAKIFIFFKLGKAISLDGNPILKNQQGINLWMGGTNFKIPEKYYYCKNNFTNMKSVFLKINPIFQIYPLNIKRYIENKNIRIVYVSDIRITKDPVIINFWKKNKNKLLKNFTKIDDINFWGEFSFFNNKDLCFFYYRKIKSLLRLEIVKKLKSKYKDKFLLIGSNWSDYKINSKSSIFNREKISKIYNGNICIDLGSIAGSLSLYPRSIDIIESGGILIQLKQTDFRNIWNNSKIYNDFLFTNFKELFLIINEILKNKDLMKKIYLNNKKQFEKSNLLIEKQFNRIF